MTDLGDRNFFEEVLNSEVAMVRCHGCGEDRPVNSAYVKYLSNGIKSCRQCREEASQQ